MIASNETRHLHHIVKGQSDRSIDLLRTSIIYGANEAGKSNLIKAMGFAREFIVDGVEKNESIGVINFKLEKSCYQKPSRFEFEFRYKSKQFAYGFSIDKSKVYDEWLFEMGHNLEVPIFERDDNRIHFNFEHDIFLDISEKEKQRIGYEAEGTRENLLFLTNCKERNIKWFNPVYEWFDDCLTIIFPTPEVVKFLPLLLTEDTDLCVFFNSIFKLFLKSFGFDIKKIDIKEIDVETLPRKIKESIKKDFSYGKKDSIAILSINKESYVIQEKAGQLKVLELVIFRNDQDNDEIAFELAEESDGTIRIIELIPVLIRLSKAHSVFVIDEIEKSLHVLLVKQLFDFMLNNKKRFENVESQLIASTHEINLLDIKRLFRKDEIWFVNKKSGESRIYSLANADVDDLDIAKGYINGR
jgi:AAA15 family ATPase/GTPase